MRAAPDMMIVGSVKVAQFSMAQEGYQCRPDMTDHVWINVPQECGLCGVPTCWAELNFFCYLCPDVCTERMWVEYEQALREDP